MYKCPSCDKQLHSNQAYEYHIKHNSCKSKFICERCRKKLKSKQAVEYHTKHNSCELHMSNNIKPKIILKNVRENNMTIDEMKQLITELSEVNSELRGEIKALRENPQTVNNHINIVVPPAFLSLDNYEHISRDIPNLLHDALSHHPANCIKYLIQETTCNPQLPQYNSIKVTNKKDPIIQISDGNMYILASKKKIIDDLIQNKREILQEYVDQKGEKYGEKILKRYENYLDALDNDKSIQKELEVDIIIMLLNISKIIGSDEWSKHLLDNLKEMNDDDFS